MAEIRLSDLQLGTKLNKNICIKDGSIIVSSGAIITKDVVTLIEDLLNSKITLYYGEI
jgi:hypothetical protein